MDNQKTIENITKELIEKFNLDLNDVQQIQLPEIKVENTEIINTRIQNFNVIKNSYKITLEKYKDIYKKIESARQLAEKVIEIKEQELKTQFNNFYKTPIEVEKKVGDTSIKITELPITIKFNNIILKKKSNFKYDEKVLMKNPDFIRVKEEVNKIKVKAEYKKTGKVKGLKVFDDYNVVISND